MRSIVLTPLHAQLDGLQMLIYALHEKVDDAQSAYSLHEKLDAAQETIYSFHEKLDDAHVKIDDAHAKLEEIYRTLDDAHAETTARLNQLGELTQTINSRLEEIAMRVRTPLRVDESTFSFRTYDGFVLAPSSDDSLLLTLLDAGPEGLQPGTRKILQKLLTPGMTFIDVGARLGILTLAGALAVGTSGRVFAIEPTPLAFELLNRALGINGLSDRVVAKCLAAGERRERGELYVKVASGHGSRRGVDGREPHKIIVEVIPLDDLVGAGERVDVVYINPKGAALEVLRGMSRIIRDNSDLAIIAEFSPSRLQELMIDAKRWLNGFSEYGFDTYVIDEVLGECRRLDIGEVHAIASTNILFLQPSSLAMSRVF